MRGGDSSSPGFEMAAKMTATQVHPVASPLPPPGKTVFPRFPWGLHRAAANEHEDVAGGAGGASSGCRREGVLPVLHSVVSSLSLRPRPGAPLTFPKASRPLPRPSADLHCSGAKRGNTIQLVGSSISKESTCNARDPGPIPGSRRSLGEGNGNPLQYTCLGNPMDRGAWWAIVHGGRKELGTT